MSNNIDLSVDLGAGLRLKNPVMTASGTFGFGMEFAELVDLEKLGAIIVKGTTLHKREGNPYPRMAETPSGMLNAVGLQNGGVDHFVNDIYPELAELLTKKAGNEEPTPVIVNVSGSSAEDYAEVCYRLAPLELVKAVEVNISCPNVKTGGMAFGTTCEGASSITSAVRKAWPRHLIVKLSPNVTDITEIAKAAEGAGADSVSLVNTFLGMAVDVEKRVPMLSTITGGLSGPCIRPIAVRMVWQVAKAVSVPVIGLGGITGGRDALEFIMAGASAVEIGTANFIDPAVTARTVGEIQDYCIRHSVDSISKLRGII